MLSIKKIKVKLSKLIEKKYVRNFYKSNSGKKVLMCYVLKPFINRSPRILKMHQNRTAALILGKIFDDLGFEVDVVNHDNPNILRKLKKNHYHFIFGMGAAFKKAMDTLSYDKAIFYATGLPAHISNKLEEERVRYVNEKYKSTFIPTRHLYEEYEDYSRIDEIVVMGNRNQINNYKKVYKGKIYLTNNLLVDFKDFKLKKDWSEAQKNFLFVGSKGKILSGLDLLLEVFRKNKDIHLHIIAGFDGEEDFLDFFSKDIFKRKNIHFYGRNEIDSEVFNEVAQKCAACILPIAAGGQNGSALTCMSYGLFPIISRNCNVDIPNGGIILKQLDEESINQAINEYLSLPLKELKNVCERTKHETIEVYSERSFERELKMVLSDIANKKDRISNPLISIIIPTYNGSKNIKRALNSALNQTYPNIEIIVVDDASTDNTVEVVNSIKDKRVKFLRHTTNKNGSAARNTGIKASSGEYIAFLDDDDEWFPEKLFKQIEYLESKDPKEWKAVVCGHTMEKSDKVREVFATKEGNLTKEILMMQVSMGLGSTLLIQKSAVEEIGFFDEKYLRHQDLEFTLRYFRRYKLAAVKECYARIHGHSGNPSGGKMLSVKNMFLEDFKQDIEQFDERTVRQIYARQWLQVSKHFALDGDVKNTFKYYFKSLSFAFLLSTYTKILPLENYLTIPYYLLTTLIFGKKKPKR